MTIVINRTAIAEWHLDIAEKKLECTRREIEKLSILERG